MKKYKATGEILKRGFNSVLGQYINKFGDKFAAGIKFYTTEQLPSGMKKEFENWFKQHRTDFRGLPPALWEPHYKVVVLNPESLAYDNIEQMKNSMRHELSHAVSDYYDLDPLVKIKPEYKISETGFRIRPDLYDPKEWVANRLTEYIEDGEIRGNSDPDEKETFSRVLEKLGLSKVGIEKYEPDTTSDAIENPVGTNEPVEYLPGEATYKDSKKAPEGLRIKRKSKKIGVRRRAKATTSPVTIRGLRL